jgi:hypothetical protein
MTTAAEWFAGKALEDIERIELGQRIIYPDKIRRVDPSDAKKTIDVEVYLRVPSVAESALARCEALAWVREVSRKDIEREDQAIALLGVSAWNEIDLYCAASQAVLTREEKPRRWMLPEFFLEVVPRATVYDVWRRVAFLSASEDFGTHDMSAQESDEVVRIIAKRRNLSPLVGMSEGTQRDFIVSMAVRLSNFLTLKN